MCPTDVSDITNLCILWQSLSYEETIVRVYEYNHTSDNNRVMRQRSALNHKHHGLLAITNSLSASARRSNPLLLHRPASTARECVDTQNRLNAVLWSSFILSLVTLYEMYSQIVVHYVTLLDDLEVSTFFLFLVHSTLFGYHKGSLYSKSFTYGLMFILVMSTALTAKTNGSSFVSSLSTHLL